MAIRRPIVSARSLILLSLAAMLLALISTAQAAAWFEFTGKAIPWLGLLKARVVDSLLYVSFVPLLATLAAAKPVTRQSWSWAVPLHLAVGAVCAMLKESLFTLIGNWFRPGVFHLTEILAGDYLDEILFFWTMTAAIHAYLAWPRVRPEQPPAKAIERFVVNGAGSYRMVAVAEIEWIGAQGNYAQLNTGQGRHLIRETMASLERRLGDRFVRVHRSAIVNRAHVDRIEPRSHGAYAIILASGAQVMTSRSYNGRLRSLLG